MFSASYIDTVKIYMLTVTINSIKIMPFRKLIMCLLKISDIFESKLPPQVQQQLMQDLVYMATDAAFAIPPPVKKLIIMVHYMRSYQ